MPNLNPPAFPNPPVYSTPDSYQQDEGSVGMELRDYFAARALQGLVKPGVLDIQATSYARSAYVFADAMLKTRQERRPVASPMPLVAPPMPEGLAQLRRAEAEVTDGMAGIADNGPL